MQVLFNGSPRELDPGTTIAGLLASLNLPSRHVAVEINLEVVPREQHERHELRPGDQIEVVTLVGGG